MISAHVAAIFLFCLIGCSVSSWFLGKQRGISDAVTYLAQQGLIIVEDEEDGEGK